MSKSEKSSKPRHKIFETIDKNDADLLKEVLIAEPHAINILDENKMTALQHASYKGNEKLVRILLDNGADVLKCKHEHNYTVLHFGALSGNAEVCLALLQAGAIPTEKNSVGRTAAQLAGFVGHHDCDTIINNFIPKDEIEYYSQVHHFTITTETHADLPPFLVESFYKFVSKINIHPVKVALNLYSLSKLKYHFPEVKKVLELMCEREMGKGVESHEILSFKFHYLSYIVGKVMELKETHVNKSDEDGAAGTNNAVDIVAIFAKKILKPSENGELETMNNFLNNCVLEYPFKECTVFQQIARAITKDPGLSTLEVIVLTINGKNSILQTVDMCFTCGEKKSLKKCSKCQSVSYCSQKCQKLHWPWHKKVCRVAASTVQQENGKTKNDDK